MNYKAPSCSKTFLALPTVIPLVFKDIMYTGGQSTYQSQGE